MVKKTKRRKPIRGTPVCIAALFCDAALVDKDGMVSIVRTLDTLIFSPDRPVAEIGIPTELHNSPAKMVVLLKRHDAVGTQPISIIQTAPSGDTEPIGLVVVDFKAGAGPETGYNFIGPIRFVWRGEGLYWFAVQTKDGTVLARTALRLKIGPKDANR